MSRRSLLLDAEPSFVIPAAKRNTQLASQQVSWLSEQGSLTRRLRLLVGPNLRVAVVLEDWCKPFCGEAKLLGLRAGRRAWIREVVLLAGESPLVLARSVIPHQMLRGRNSALARLGQRPLGEWLFSHPELRRLSLTYTTVRPSEWRRDLSAAEAVISPVCGRRSHYQVSARALLVCEFFLPDLFRLENADRQNQQA